LADVADQAELHVTAGHLGEICYYKSEKEEKNGVVARSFQNQ
jgi:hypothetical protein